MPSPVGHAIAGVAAGWAVAGSRLVRRPALARSGREPWRYIVLFAAIGMSPDIDLLFGAHSGPTHGLGAALIAGFAAGLLTRTWHVGFAAAAAYGSHTLLDWLGSDTSPPRGIMALWPLSREHYESSLHLFQAISRRYWQHEFWTDNFRALAWELVILVPVLVAVLWRLGAGDWGLEAEGRGLEARDWRLGARGRGMRPGGSGSGVETRGSKSGDSKREDSGSGSGP